MSWRITINLNNFCMFENNSNSNLINQLIMIDHKIF